MFSFVIICIVLISSRGVASDEEGDEKASFIIDYCMTKECRHNGKCKLEDGIAKCECEPPYVGEDCSEVNEEITTESTIRPEEETQTEIDHCSPNPCENGGFCRNGNSSWECDCILPYSGKDCSKVFKETTLPTTSIEIASEPTSTTNKVKEIVDYCYEEPCGEHGSCKIDGEGFICICETSYSGDVCDKEEPILSTTLEPEIPNSTLSTTPESSNLTTTNTSIHTSDPTTSSFSPSTTSGRISTESSTTEKTFPTSTETTKNETTKSSTTRDNTTIVSTSTTIEDTTTASKSPVTSVDTTIESKSPTTSGDTTKEFKSTTPSGSTTIDHDLCISSPCLNNGSCISVDNNVRCSCTYPFGGELCDTDLSDKNQSSSNSVVYACAGSAGAIVFVFLIGFSVLWHLKRVKRKKKESYFHNADLSSMESENSRTYII